MKKLLCLSMVLILLLGSSAFVFAVDTNSSPVVKSTDTYTQLKDIGVGDIINSVSNKDTKAKLIEYYCTPAYKTSTLDAASVDDQRAQVKDQVIISLTKLSKLSGTDLDKEIVALKDARIKSILNDPNAVPTAELINYAEKNNSSYVKQLKEKVNNVAKDTDSEEATQSVASVIVPMSSITKSTYGESYTYNAGGAVLYYITCNVQWTYNSTTYYITSLLPTTHYGSDGIYNFNSSLLVPPSGQSITRVSGVDIGKVHKSVGVYNALTPAIQGFSWWLIADVHVTGKGVISLKNVDTLTYLENQLYSWN